MDEEFLPWTEKYRPHSLTQVIGQEETINSLKAFVKARNMPNMLFAGPPGIGKTTATLALSHDLYGKHLDGNVLELNASDERGIDIVRGKIKDFARSVSFGGEVPFKLIFLDEADALTPEAQNAMRRTMEVYSSVTRFILSCNYSSKIIEPVQSRCAIFRFLPLTDPQVHKMIKHIAEKEGLSVDEKAEHAIAYVSEGDMRRAINCLQGAAIHSKKITEELVYKISSQARPKEIREMVECAYKGNFLESRKMLLDLSTKYGLAGSDIILQIYREISNMEMPERKKVELVDKIGEYDFRLVEGANERIQIEALLAQIMMSGMEK
jgi:replication factor C small subunit